ASSSLRYVKSWKGSANARASAFEQRLPCRRLSRECWLRRLAFGLGGARDHELGDLHGVQRSTFEQLIARDEQRDRAAFRIAQILPDAADEQLVLTGRVFRH